MTYRAFSCPADPWMTRTARIVSIVDEIPGVATYELAVVDARNPGDYSFIPGQFNMLYLPGVGESAISMSGDSTRTDAWIHTVRVAGNVTQSLAKLRPGESLGIRGPFGSGWPVDSLAGDDIIIVAGGLGLAPVRPLIYHLLHHREQFGQIWLICGARTPDALMYSREYDVWRNAGITLQLTVDRAEGDWKGQIGVVIPLIDRLRIPRPNKTQLVACGPEVMMKYAAASGLHLGLHSSQIWLSLERNMQCATGLCGHCQLGPEFICKDGPVLRYDRIQSFLFVEQL